MRPIVGWWLDGPCHRQAPANGALLGQPCWGPAALLRDLELRLGLPQDEAAPSARVPAWARRLDALLPSSPFYARSFAADRIGTATALLSWRDGLIEAGWRGAQVSGGGARLDALAAIEAQTDEALPMGRVDRLAAVVRALQQAPGRIYEAVALAEDRATWPQLWRRAFDELARLGTRFEQVSPPTAMAQTGSDLELAQRALRGARGLPPAAGDGSLLLVRGDTPAELAEIAAALIGNEPGAVVVRAQDAAPLEAALAAQGGATQGLSSRSAWRPSMQVLPLALELGFEPRDPYRVLELLTLPQGPFSGVLGARLARAVSRQPGIGGAEWQRQKDEAAKRLRDWKLRACADAPDAEAQADEYVAARLNTVEEWLESPGFQGGTAPRAALQALGERVRAWTQKRLTGPEAHLYGAAYAQAQAFVTALVHDTRETLTREEARSLLDQLARGAHSHELWPELAGRATHVREPGALLAPADTVLVWGFVSSAERPPLPPWNAREREALQASGVAFCDPALLLQSRADAWRRTVLGAARRAIFFVPGTLRGEPQAPHPLWDELRARLALDDPGVARLTRRARAVLEGREPLVATAALSPLPLPEPLGAWNVPVDLLGPAGDKAISATSLEKLVSCPLSWVLSERAAVHSGAIARVASGSQLFGTLSHRLVELLHEEGAFSLAEQPFVVQARATFGRLLEREGAMLLLPGAASERHQLVEQVAAAMRALHRYLARSGWRIAGIEEPVEFTTAIGAVKGRLDVRLLDPAGRPGVLDLKWGKASYSDRLRTGRAVQLAVYARALGPDVPAGYFALSAGEVLANDERLKPSSLIDGPSLGETLARVETTAQTVLERQACGEVLVSATARAEPLLTALGVPPEQHDRQFVSKPEDACRYCSYDVLCGRRWEVAP